jgi:hypothetical protein
MTAVADLLEQIKTVLLQEATFPLLWVLGNEWSLIKFGREREDDLVDLGCLLP